MICTCSFYFFFDPKLTLESFKKIPQLTVYCQILAFTWFILIPELVYLFWSENIVQKCPNWGFYSGFIPSFIYSLSFSGAYFRSGASKNTATKNSVCHPFFFIWNFIGTQPREFTSMLFMTAFSFQQQEAWVVAIKTLRPKKPNILTISLFRKSVSIPVRSGQHPLSQQDSNLNDMRLKLSEFPQIC